jgi:hypothetical protein
MKKLVILLMLYPIIGISQYYENITVYDEYGNDLGSFEIESNSSFGSSLEEAIENGVGVAVDKYIDYLKQKERKEQAIRSRQSWEQRGARVGVSIPSYVNSTAAFEGLIIQREQAAYKRKVNAIAKARARARQAETRAGQAEARVRQAEARARQAEARARQAEAQASQRSTYNRSSNKSYTPNSTRNSSNSSGWVKRYLNRGCYIVKEPSLFGERIQYAVENETVEVKLDEVDKSGKFVRARLTKISRQGWINISHLK